MRQLGNSDGADVTQKVFVSVSTSIKNFQGRSSFRTFLFRIVRCRISDHLRSRKKDFDPLTHSVEDVGVTPSYAMDQVTKHWKFIQCIDQLTYHSREVLDLYYWNSMTAREVGELLDISESTVRSRLHTARGQLKRILDKNGERPLADEALDQKLQMVYRFYTEGPAQS